MTGPIADPSVASEVALVTGAASGIGAAVTRRFLSLGYSVLGVDQAEMPPEFSSHAVNWVQGDVGSPATWAEVDRVVEATAVASPAVAVMNAATFRTGDVLGLSLADWSSVLNTNVLGAALGMKAVLPGMVSRHGGTIVTVASVDGLAAEQGAASYCASKAALIQLSKATAVDFARQGVRVNCVCPGTTDTPMFRCHLARSHDPPAMLAQRTARNPLGRLLLPDEVASAVEFLAGPSSSGITGAVLTIDAGLTASYDFRELG
jgi:NAD(P)-dependent dehydrogenase (short-subunit alcohol dehydrogenase family)